MVTKTKLAELAKGLSDTLPNDVIRLILKLLEDHNLKDLKKVSDGRLKALIKEEKEQRKKARLKAFTDQFDGFLDKAAALQKEKQDAQKEEDDAWK